MIDVSRITAREKLIIAKGLLDYCFIMNNWKNNDDDFKKVYYDYYLKARWSVMHLPENKNPYFDKLQSINPDDDFMDILYDLKKNMGSNSYEFSLGTKLLHTRNSSKPIYDSKVCKYLKNEENVDFWWHNSPRVRGNSRGLCEKEKIKHDWNLLNEWYNIFLTSSEGKKWVQWFDDNFPTYAKISNVKKVDFIIFATR